MRRNHSNNEHSIALTDMYCAPIHILREMNALFMAFPLFDDTVVRQNAGIVRLVRSWMKAKF